MRQDAERRFFIEPAGGESIVEFGRSQRRSDQPGIAAGEQLIKCRISCQAHAAMTVCIFYQKSWI